MSLYSKHFYRAFERVLEGDRVELVQPSSAAAKKRQQQLLGFRRWFREQKDGGKRFDGVTVARQAQVVILTLKEL